MRQHSCRTPGVFGRAGSVSLSGVAGIAGLLAALVVGVACDSGEPRDPEPRGDEGVVAASPNPDAKTPMAAPEGAGEAEPREAEPLREGAEARAFLETLEPVKTRAGHLRFTAREIADPQAAMIFGYRLAEPGSPQELRLALAEVLHRSGGDWSAVLLGQLDGEQDPAVRAILVSTLAKASEGPALLGIHVGLLDPDPGVRRAAAELAGWAPSAGRESSVAGPLQAALLDENAEVRAAASRSLGLLGEVDRFELLVPGLADADAEVRLQALRALERLDSRRAAALPAVASLAAEGSDPRVKRAATKLRADVSDGAK